MWSKHTSSDFDYACADTTYMFLFISGCFNQSLSRANTGPLTGLKKPSRLGDIIEANAFRNLLILIDRGVGCLADTRMLCVEYSLLAAYYVNSFLTSSPLLIQ